MFTMPNPTKGSLAAKVCRPWQDSNLQSPVSETDALSIRPQGRGVNMSCIGLIQEVK